MRTIVCIISLFFIQLSFSQQGTLDVSFDIDGKKNFGFGSSNDYGEFVLMQPDTKIIVGGRSSLSGGNLSFAIARLNANGTFDNSFGTNGKVTTSYGTDGFEAIDGVLQSDGKIVVVGNQNTNSSLGYSQVGIVRYNSNGSLDTTFDVDGMVFTQLPSSNEDFAKSVKIQSDGKIIIGVQSKINSNWDFVLIRYNIDGSLDTTFGTGGISRTILNATNEVIYDIDLQTDNKIVAAGYISGTSNDDLAVFRYNIDGSLDSTFASNGMFVYDFASNHNYVFGVTVANNGKILLTGRYQNGAISSPFIARLNVNGVFDTSFDSDGILIQTTDEMPNDILVQSDNKIIVLLTSNLKFGVWKLNENGSFDTAFGTNGKVETLIGSVYSLGSRGAIQSDGKIVMVGSAIISSFMDFVVVRYHNDAPLNITKIEKRMFLVYPNPSNGEFTIQTTSEMIGAKVEVYNVIGQKLKSFELNAIETKHSLNQGFYIVDIEKDGKKAIQKIQIQ